MATYRHFFTDLITGAFRGDVPASDVTMTRTLSATGSYEGKLDIKDERARQAYMRVPVIIPGRTAWWMDRDGLLIGGGIVWDDDYDSSSRMYSFSGSTFDSYPDHTVCSQLLLYANQDLCDIAIQLWQQVQGGVDGSDINVIVPPTGTIQSGQNTTLQLDPSQQARYGASIQQLSQQQPGFDYLIDIVYDAFRNPTAAVVFGGPYVGKSSAVTDVVFHRPGNVADYTWPRAWDQSPNTLVGIGASAAITATYHNAAMISAGYPIITDTVQYATAYDEDTLQSLVNAKGTSTSSGVTTPTLTLSPDHPQSPVGEFREGDACRVIFDPDERFPLGLDTFMRVSSVSVSPQQAGQEEKIVVSLSQAVQ